MRIGLNDEKAIPHSSPAEWAEKLRSMGFLAASFPVDYTAPDVVIDAYAKAAADYDILISEVGAWCSPFAKDPAIRAASKERIYRQLELADYIHAVCCTNVSGAFGDGWTLCYAENFGQSAWDENVAFMQELLDTVRPQHTVYTLEPMQWMIPDSPEQYLNFIRAVNRDSLKVHLDVCNFVKDPYTYTHQDELIDRTFDLLGDLTVSCHLKDVILDPGITVSIHETILGTGVFPAKHYLDRIAQLGNVAVMLEHLPDLASYEKALAYAKSIYTFEEP